jgi:SEC-C motif-containing protein
MTESQIENAAACPCQSEKTYADCCQRYHQNTIGDAATPEGLMRSRYCAYSLGLADYLIKTIHASHPQASKNVKKWKAELSEYCKSTKFTGLEVIDHAMLSPTEATVTFKAYLEQAGQAFTLSEKSKFIRLNSGRWIYHSALELN